MCQTATACLLHPPVSEASSLKNLKCRQYGIDSAERMAYISDTSPRIHEPRPCAAASAGMPFWPFHSPYTAPGDAMFRYVHTNIIAKNAARLIAFYKQALHCKSIGQTRDLRGPWLDRLTGLPKAHITGEHLLLPGYDGSHPTLEIFSYDNLRDTLPPEVNRPGLAHLAFEVDDVETTLAEIVAAGGGQVGEVVTAAYPNDMEAVFVYARDPEGNIIELQSWRKVEANS